MLTAELIAIPNVLSSHSDERSGQPLHFLYVAAVA